MASSIVVASGKGGVGKTSVAVNLGLTLARQGRRTILLDADFGMANAHILLGANPQQSIIDAIQGKCSIAEVVCDAPIGMKFISGGTGLLEMLNLDKKTRYQTIRMLDELNEQTEILIADVPAGASDSSLAFVAAADRVIIVLVGEPTSFLDAYALIKAAHLEAGVDQFSILVNMARNTSDAEKHFEKFKTTATRFLNVNLHYAGHLPLSERMRNSVVRRRPIGIEDPELPENQALMHISKSVISSPQNDNGGIRFFSNK